MLAEIRITPLDSLHAADDIALAVDAIRASGIGCRVGPMGTSVEGEWEQVMAAAKAAHQAVAQRHGRVMTSIVIDDQKDGSHTLDEAVAMVA